MLALAGGAVLADYYRGYPSDVTPQFVGRSACVDCHRDQTEHFTGSHHDLAMDVATDATVLGDFGDAVFTHHGIESRMYRDGDRFMIHTEGESGEMRDFEIKYVFGVDPLQQYMVEFDRDASMDEDEIARVQVLRISWDTEKKVWFYLPPPDVDEKLQPGDPLHWTGIAQRWQTMCADCHSTNLQANFDVASGRYHTTFSEIDVSCESCHGPGSMHVEMATSKSLFWDRNHGYGLAGLKGDDPTGQLDSCAPCHSRRGVISDTYHAGLAFSDHFDLERLTEATYHNDGQIKDEVYVYGSFIQSKMYHKGIRCTDCHDPHTLEMKYPGNQTCTSCHQHAAGKYDVPSHHHHTPGTRGAMCVNCHMPHTTYMEIDERRDHSLRVPRPDLSVSLGTPNACSSCHIEDVITDDGNRIAAVSDDPSPAETQTNESQTNDLKDYAQWLMAAKSGNDAAARQVSRVDQWCDAACERWYGQSRYRTPHFADAMARFRSDDSSERRSGAAELLRIASGSVADVPAIARATAFDELSMSAGPESRRSVEAAIKVLAQQNSEPMVRASAAAAMVAASPTRVRQTLVPILDDPSRLVRLAAARTILQSGSINTLSGGESQKLRSVVDELQTALMTTADRAGSHMAWASICEMMDNPAAAIDAYRDAIRVEPGTTGPRTNLAMLLERTAGNPGSPMYEQVMNEVVQLRRDELPLMKRDAELVPEMAGVQYRYGLSLYLAGEHRAALTQLKKAVDLEPDNPSFRAAFGSLDAQLRRSSDDGGR